MDRTSTHDMAAAPPRARPALAPRLRPRYGGGGPRARRGDVRAAALALLTERPMHGYEMIKEIEERTEGLWRPSAGSIYPTLALLEDEGLIRGEESDGKRRFALTDEGREQAEVAQGQPAVGAGHRRSRPRRDPAARGVLRAARGRPAGRHARARRTRRLAHATCSTRRASASTRSSPRTPR